MTHAERFEHLNESDKLSLLQADGIYLDASRYTSKLIIDLYALQDFFVEVFYDIATEEVLYIKRVRTTQDLEPYLDRIDISPLVNLLDKRSFPE